MPKKGVSGGSSGPKRTRIAVLGGGLGALVSVYELLSQPGAAENYEISVYAMGHRLGGKCASGRDQEMADRVLEHGLHIWFGCYHEGFRFLRRLYAELPEGVALERDWESVFKPHRSVELWDNTPNGWTAWRLEFPDNHFEPGLTTPLDDLPSLVRGLGRWVKSFFEMALVPPEHRESLLVATQALVGNLFRGGISTVLKLLDRGVEGLLAGRKAPWIRGIRHRLATAWETRAMDEGSRRFWILVDLSLTVLTGVAQDQLLLRGTESLDQLDFREWLRRHGASRLTLESAPLRVVYDMIFAYEEGDRSRPNASAGTLLVAILKMLFSYAGSFSYKMQTGMGDAVLAPLYEVLRHKGVRFHFFSRVERLEPAANGLSVGRVTIQRQATLKEGSYQPFIKVKERLCWPERPLHDQLMEGAELIGHNLELPSDSWSGVGEFTLEHQRDFDHIILGIPAPALKKIAAPLAAIRADWQRMLQGLGSVATIGAQLWMKESAETLRPGCSAGKEPLVGGYSGLFDTWADMSHLAAAENWKEVPRSIFYGCAPIAETQKADPTLLVDFLRDHGSTLWPGAGAPFRFEVLLDPQEREGEKRVQAQFLKFNQEASDRYVQSLVGTNSLRLAPDASGFQNLWLAGDWTKTYLNLGNVESTIRSALRCAAGLRLRVET